MREVSADPAFLTVKEGSKRVASRDLSPVRLTKAVLDRIDHLDRQTKAYVTVFRASAVEAAQEAAQCIKESGPIGPLHGIPVALKDIYDIKDLPTLCGSRVREGHTATADSEVARRLREAGAIIIGKTVTHEFAYGVVSPPTRNPWDLGRIPGGSSGGSGAAVAADLCLAAMGSDTGGSIRIPAALNGIVGIKPTFGRVSKRGVVPGSWSLDHVGPLTKTVADAALLLQALAGYDPADGCSIDVPVPDYLDALNAGVEALRIGVPAKYFFDSVDPQVDSAVRDAISTLEQLGAEVIDVEIPRLELTSPVVLCIVGAEASAFHQRSLRRCPELYTNEVRALLQAGKLVSGRAYVNAQRARALIKDGFRTALSQVDVLATPTLPTVAASSDSSTVHLGGTEEPLISAYTRLTAPANVAGLPALSLPCGFSKNGLPISLQLIGRPFDESTVLRVGHAYEAVTSWHMQNPLL